jgi:hypothetical protein
MILDSIISLACIKNGARSWLLSFAPLLGEVEMDMTPLLTFPLKATDSVLELWSFRLSSALLMMIPTERTIAENELAPLYYPGNENFYGKTHCLLSEYAIFNNMFRNTLTPKHGDCTSICGTTRNLLLAILDSKPPPCISTFL